MTAAEVLTALRRHHRNAALVPELTIADDWADYDWDPATALSLPIHTRRIDALMFDARVRTAIEIKVTASDAKRESPAKVWPWRRVCHRFYYAVPAGLIEHPPVYGCGLWWVHPTGRVEVRRKSKVSPCPEPLPQNVVQALAYRAVGMEVAQ